MYDMTNFKSKSQKEKEAKTLHIKREQPHGISGETQAYAKSIAGVHDTKEKKSRTKDKNGVNGSRKAAKVALNKGNWD